MEIPRDVIIFFVILENVSPRHSCDNKILKNMQVSSQAIFGKKIFFYECFCMLNMMELFKKVSETSFDSKVKKIHFSTIYVFKHQIPKINIFEYFLNVN